MKSTNSSDSGNRNKNSRAKRRTICICLALILLICIGVLIMLLSHSRKSSSGSGGADAKASTTENASKNLNEAATSTVNDSTNDQSAEKVSLPEKEKIKWNPDWEYAEFSKINSGSATLYYSQAENRKDFIVCVNAGHGTKGGESVKTQCHPDGSAKVSGGTTSAGSISAVAVSSGTTLSGGTSEASANLKVAKALKKKLLEEGYDVLMIRKKDDVQLDNVARTVMANNIADCHIAIHYDSTDSNKGAFYIGAADVSSYRKMEPVASHWKEHKKLGEAIIKGFKKNDVKVFGDGVMNMDLTQISYSTIPSVDLEVGDRGSSTSDETIDNLVKGIVAGVDKFAKSQEKSESGTKENTESQENAEQ